MNTADAAQKCQYCGLLPHQGVCPSVKAFEYHPDGTLKRVEFKTASDHSPLFRSSDVLAGPPEHNNLTTFEPARSTSSAYPSLCDSGGELWDADEAS